MPPDDDENFLKLAACLKIILARSIWYPDLPRARTLMREFLHGFLLVSSFFVLIGLNLAARTR